MTPLSFSYDAKNDTLEIEGLKYAGGLFRAWAEKAPLGIWVIARDGVSVTMRAPSAAELRMKAEEITARAGEGFSRVFLDPETPRVAVVTAAGMVREYPHHGTAASDCTRYFANQGNAADYYIGAGWKEELR